MKKIKAAVAIAFSVMLTGVFCSCGSNATSSSVSGKNNQTNSSTSKAIENSSASNSSELKEAKESSENNSSALKGASVGDIVKFGKYEQDNNSSNGKEEIEWVVLAKESDRILIISKYILDSQVYNTSETDVTWETCSLRKWLNETFISNAFSSDEQKMIPTRTVKVDKHPKYDTSPGNDTTDKVFLLSITELNKYFSSAEARKCTATARVHENDYHRGEWWLRTSGYGNIAAAVDGNGNISDGDGFAGTLVIAHSGVRPAMWINLGSENQQYQEAIENQQYQEPIEKNSSTLNGVSVGDIVKFGAYEQDNNTSNGKEEIEWKVLAKEGDKALIISKYALDSQPYNTSYSSVTWETCSLRKWLNGSFENSAFNAEERKMIVQTNVTADKNPSYSTSPGNNTTDRVFLLSVTEVSKYFSSDEARKCVPTEYTKTQGVYPSEKYSVGGKATCGWWLRSPGRDSKEAAGVSDGGSVRDRHSFVNYDIFGVRPAMWINLGSQQYQEPVQNQQ